MYEIGLFIISNVYKLVTSLVHPLGQLYCQIYLILSSFLSFFYNCTEFLFLKKKNHLLHTNKSKEYRSTKG
jgi:hypothetical protein